METFESIGGFESADTFEPIHQSEGPDDEDEGPDTDDLRERLEELKDDKTGQRPGTGLDPMPTTTPQVPERRNDRVWETTWTVTPETGEQGQPSHWTSTSTSAQHSLGTSTATCRAETMESGTYSRR